MNARILLLVIIALLIMALTTLARAADLTFLWDPNTEPDLAGYRLYMAQKQGDHSTPWTKIGQTTQTTLMVTIPDTGGFIFCVTAFDTAGNESFPSNVAIHGWKLKPPANFKKQ